MERKDNTLPDGQELLRQEFKRTDVPKDASAEPDKTRYCAIMNFAHVPLKVDIPERARIFVQNSDLETVNGKLRHFKDSGISDTVFRAYVVDLVNDGHKRNDIWNFKFPHRSVATFAAHQSEIDALLKRHDAGRFCLFTQSSKGEVDTLVRHTLAQHEESSQPRPYLDA